MQKIIKILTLSLCLVFCVLSSAFAQKPQFIRVVLIQDAKSLNLKIKGFFEIIEPQTNKVLYRGKELKTTATLYQDNILLGKVSFRKSKVLIKTSDPFAIIIDGRKFRGDIQLINKDNRVLLVVNNIELEDYIKGILYHEASHYWPPEALKAQAIACRTYALYQMQENSHRDWDVTSDIYSQVYGGKTSERYRTNKAVDETKGLVLSYQDKIFPAYFHATCGGYTEDASMLWNNNIPPLKGVACGFCKESPHFNWHSVLSLKEIEDSLAKSDYKIKGIETIEVISRDRSGRIINLLVRTKNRNMEIPAKDFRILVGANVIRSTNFNISVVGQDAVFVGAGWGHGVGLCQWGAYFLAKEGKNHEEILKYYYPGSDVKTIGF